METKELQYETWVIIIFFFNETRRHHDPSHLCKYNMSVPLLKPSIRGVCVQAGLLCDIHTESHWGGNRGHHFPEDRLAARAINYKRQGDRQRVRQTDRQTDSTAESADRPRQIQSEDEEHVRPRKIILPLQRVQLSAPPLLLLLPVDCE